jgi:membrane-associated protease RseP (regulator of RpoE activity)
MRMENTTMKKLARFGTLALGFLALAATSAAAQRYGLEPARRAWLGLSYEITVERGADRVQTLVITNVVDGSPAERAGLRVGDTLLDVNDIAATDELLSSLAVSLKPGDVVQLRVLRDGRERQLDVEAGSPPAQYYEIAPRRGIIRFNSDSLRGQLSIMMDSLRLHFDSLQLPNFYVERLPDGIRFGTDSAGVRFFRFDSLAVRMDTLSRSFEMWGNRLGNDRELRVWRFPEFEGRLLQLDSLASARIYRFDGDSLSWGRGGRVQALPYGGITMWGAQSIGGAELTEVNSALGEYFGTDHGVLIVRVHDRTPAAEAGLRDGDVIVAADGEAVESIGELRRALRDRTGTVQLDVLRKRERIRITFEQQ